MIECCLDALYSAQTTPMDVLSGRKTRGSVTGQIYISGYPKKQETFARVSGYCEQNDIHSPQITVRESLIFSAFLRLSPDVESENKEVLFPRPVSAGFLRMLRKKRRHTNSSLQKPLEIAAI